MACLFSFLCLPRWARSSWFSRSDSDIPTIPPGRNFKWDVGRQSSRIEQAFIIEEYRIYNFDVGFGSPVAWDDKAHQEWRKDRRAVDLIDAIDIPIHIQVQKINEAGDVSVLIDQDARTEPKFTGGDVLTRHIATVKLRPGKYKVIASTLQETVLPEGVGTYLHIGFYPKSTTFNDNE